MGQIHNAIALLFSTFAFSSTFSLVGGRRRLAERIHLASALTAISETSIENAAESSERATKREGMFAEFWYLDPNSSCTSNGNESLSDYSVQSVCLVRQMLEVQYLVDRRPKQQPRHSLGWSVIGTDMVVEGFKIGT